MLKICIAAGGTGGHIFPGISIAQEFLRYDSKSVEITFIGSKDGFEKKIIADYGFDIKLINIKKLYRYFTLKNILFPLFLIKGYAQALNIMKIINCNIFIGCGGFVSGATGLAAKTIKIPIFLQEQNVYPGLSTRVLAATSKKIYLGNPEANKYLKLDDSRFLLSGNPIRKFKRVTKEKALKHWNFKNNQKTLFICGGSQGARSINQSFIKIIDDLLDRDIQIIFQIGKSKYDSVILKYKNNKKIVIKPFIEEIEYAYIASDLVISRAGAISLTEISHFALPAIIIPFPFSAGNHQIKNAMSYVKAGAAKVIFDEELNDKILMNQILKLIYDHKNLKKMSEATRKFSTLEASKLIVDDILETYRGVNL